MYTIGTTDTEIPFIHAVFPFSLNVNQDSVHYSCEASNVFLITITTLHSILPFIYYNTLESWKRLHTKTIRIFEIKRIKI